MTFKKVNREFKFKAYLIKEKRIVDVLVLHKDYIECPFTQGILTNNGNTSQTRFDINEVEIMQYIGLKDKQGNEIYHNHIVEVETEWGKQIYLVVWEKYEAAFAFYPLNLKSSINYNIASQWTETKVIGNLFQNPDCWIKQNVK